MLIWPTFIVFVARVQTNQVLRVHCKTRIRGSSIYMVYLMLLRRSGLESQACKIIHILFNANIDI